MTISTKKKIEKIRLYNCLVNNIQSTKNSVGVTLDEACRLNNITVRQYYHYLDFSDGYCHKSTYIFNVIIIIIIIIIILILLL